MIRKAQSIFDFLRLFPAKPQKEKVNTAQLLLQAWDGPRDKNGNVLLPDNITLADATELIERGFIKHKWPGSRAIEITDKGKVVINSTVLSETSSFEKNKMVKKSDNWINKITRYGSDTTSDK